MDVWRLQLYCVRLQQVQLRSKLKREAKGKRTATGAGAYLYVPLLPVGLSVRSSDDGLYTALQVCCAHRAHPPICRSPGPVPIERSQPQGASTTYDWCLFKWASRRRRQTLRRASTTTQKPSLCFCLGIKLATLEQPSYCHKWRVEA